MCGIIGITGSTTTRDRLINGLRRLEYRGYDSAGLAVNGADGLDRSRAVGKIKALESALHETPIDGPTGIAHTRWATHGRPTEANAHPHATGRVVIVHNGIIENFADIRVALKDRAFESETDSEVIAHLMDENLSTGASTEAAFQATLNALKGAFAIAMMIEGEAGRIYLARRGSPLVIGYGDGEMYLGSDAIALAGLTRDVCYLEEGDWAVMTPHGVEIRDASGTSVRRPKVESKVDGGMIEKGEYAHFMLKEIHEQSDTVARTLAPYIDQSSRRFTIEPNITQIFKDADRAVAVACGTAYFAALTSKYWFEDLARLPLECDIASEYRYRNPVLPTSGPALFVSQSGETADTLAAAKYSRQQGAPAIAVVNVPESSIAREVDYLLPTSAGPEIGVASTKAFTAQLSVLAATAVAAGAARGLIDDTRHGELIDDLNSAPRLIAEALAAEPSIAEIGQAISGARDILFLGRGRFQPLAFEGALKMKEISYIHAEGYAAGELKHGPIALITDGVPVVVIAPYDDLFEKTRSNMEEIQARGASVVLISDERGLDAAGGRADHIIRLP
ncbi:MAG: glutamine--fructose-6-phosphate transaminase (isomerizing), partial [Pseudomonadota bacterium]